MKLINVSPDRFYAFIESKNLKKVQATYFHSYNYVNEQGEVLAYYESSSWNTNIIYKIMGEENEETLNLVTDIINKK